jgi:hypothetical protein
MSGMLRAHLGPHASHTLASGVPTTTQSRAWVDIGSSLSRRLNPQSSCMSGVVCWVDVAGATVRRCSMAFSRWSQFAPTLPPIDEPEHHVDQTAAVVAEVGPVRVASDGLEARIIRHGI